MMKRFFQSVNMIITALILSLIGHAYIIYRFSVDGLLFTGPNDGLEQMVPIQMFLYQKWSEGTFFYTTDFGLGGDFFTDLSYYFSTNIIFIITALITWLLHHWGLIDPTQMMYWLKLALIVSILKCACIILATYAYARYIHLKHHAAILFAFLFATSPIYFRFTVYWPFFSDVFIWMPLLFLSIERFFRTGKIGLFVIIVAISFINNFYFAYYQVLMGIIYYLSRLIYRHDEDLIHRKQSFVPLVVGAILGVGASLFFFFHGVHSFLNNSRVPYSGRIPFVEPFNSGSNLFYDNYLIVILFITIQALLTFKLYRHFYFRLFAILSLITIVCAFIPYVDSLFNGFSAPQKRWHYLLAFASSGLIACYLHHFKSIDYRTYIFTSIPAILVVWISAYFYERYVTWIYMLPAVFFIGLLALLLKNTQTKYIFSFLFSIYLISLFVLNLLVSLVFTKYQIFHQDHEKRANRFYVEASLYNTPLQQELVNDMKSQLRAGERIDWRVNAQDNTPMYQNFRGLSLYSSIFDHHLVALYYHELMINLKEESVSRYQSTGSRSNIASLFSVRYQMLKDYQHELPANFQWVKQQGQYQIYENQDILPPVRVMARYYRSSDLKHPLDREHAMIEGVVLDNKGDPYPTKTSNLINKVYPSYIHAHKIGRNKIKVSQPEGGLRIHVPYTIRKNNKDFYLIVYVKKGLPDSNSTIIVNDYQNNRLFNDSIYRTGQNELLYRTQPDENGNIRIQFSPQGIYHFQLRGLYGENYQILKKANHHMKHHLVEKQGKFFIRLRAHQGGMAVINIPYRLGMSAKVDGKKVKVEKVNYMMTGVPVSAHAKEIQLTYRPPYFITMIIISIFSVGLSFMFSRWCRQHYQKRKSEKVEKAN